MARASVFVFFAYLLCLVAAAPILISGNTIQKRAFALQDYADFQISDGVAGDAEALAKAVFVDPFEGADLATVSDQTQNDVETMRKAAEAAETGQFNPAIDAADGAEGFFSAADALQNGKIKNKVLKLTGSVQVLNIKIAKAAAKGDDTSDLETKLQTQLGKLNKNIATDVAAAGEASKGVV
ncbi:hypothetical protein BDN71DRAFT_1387890 [Pleurotus eryngii]|uniref:Small secreted protein n=1 Tax=Pleurotus eryngii TaxID=5323 RepID=A0A9P6DAA0_PLEER|nr:hypothetical protein BDN71DRAFT_1387890 [Pleurotus eryngii]